MQAAIAIPLTGARTLADLAADFPGWHIWRSRDRRGRDDGWNATRRKAHGPVPPGTVARLTAADAEGLRGQLEQQRVAETRREVSAA
jgi:hypothetical protein